MFTDDNDGRDITFGVVVVAIVVIALIVVARLRDPAPSPSEASAQNSGESAPGSSEPEPLTVTPRTSSRVIATVYECLVGGERIISDRPCGPNAEILEIAAPNRMIPQDTSRLFEPPDPGASYSIAPSRPSSGASAVPVNGAACDAIQRRIDEINARMRQKYTSREGEYYRERLRELSDARWDANCRWRKN